MKKQRESVENLMERIRSNERRLTEAHIRAAIYSQEPVRNILVQYDLDRENENIKKEIKALNELNFAAHSLNQTAAVGKKKLKSDEARGIGVKRTKALRSAEQTSAIEDEAKHLIRKNTLFKNKADLGKPDTITAAIQKRIENKTVKKENEILYTDKGKNRTAPSFSTIRRRVDSYLKSRNK